MLRATITGTGYYLPPRVVTNHDLAQMMETSDDWIVQRTGIRARHHVDWKNAPMGSAEMGARAAAVALESAGLTPQDVDCIVYATLSPDRAFPGDGVLVQQKLDVPAGVPAFDVRNQCSGFLYGLQMADAFIRLGTYRRILLIGAETHSSGLDFTTRGRDVAVLFGDGAGAVVLEAREEERRGVLEVRVHADGRYADALHDSYPSSAVFPRIDEEQLPDPAVIYPQMQGKQVFKHAVTRMPEVVHEVLDAQGLGPQDLDLLIPHQANLRISEMVQKRLELPDEKVFNNIMQVGNTTAASLPLALAACAREGRLRRGGLVCLCAFGAGFTWGAALIRW